MSSWRSDGTLGRKLHVALALTAFAVACKGPPPVRLDLVGEERIHDDIDACALYGDVLSDESLVLLQLVELDERFERDPDSAITELHGWLVSQSIRHVAFTLAETSYLTAKRTGNADFFLLAALYAFDYLEGEGYSERANPYDRRFRWACAIYNRSLNCAFQGVERGTFEPEQGARHLPVGSIDISVDYRAFPYELQDIEFLLADQHEVVGLEFRLRDSGLGASLVAVVEQKGEGSAGIGIQDHTSVSATAFLRPVGSVRDLEKGIAASLELHSTYDRKEVLVSGRSVPLASDVSATIAYGTQISDFWRFDLLGLFRGQDAAKQNGLILPRPFQRGRIPVILVHGTASSPAYWADLYNLLSFDPVLRSRYQLVFFLYSTGNPIPFSAATLRETLTEFVEQYDPQGTDDALTHMVVVGHSQGGLLTKMTAVTLDADEASQKTFGTPIAGLGLDAEGERLFRRLFDVEPLPFVERLVFIATPHRGSFLSEYFFARWIAKFIAVPGEIVSGTNRILRNVPREKLPAGMDPRVATSLDNMNPNAPFVKLSNGAPLDPRVRTHSIIAIGDAEEPEGADDGVVAYESAHLEGVESEVLVPSGHSCQSHPRTIIEMRRILHEHLESIDSPQAASKP